MDNKLIKWSLSIIVQRCCKNRHFSVCLAMDTKIFQFFKVADAAVLNFQLCEISLADSVWKARTHHHAKGR